MKSKQEPKLVPTTNKIKRTITASLTDLICQSITRASVKYVFMIPGGYVDNFSQSIVNTHGLKAIVSASEGGAAMMADGYARAGKKFGVCLGISGPGVSNMITGLSVSLADEIPILVITGEPPLLWRDRDAIQDPGTQGLNSIALLKLVSNEQYQVLNANTIHNYLQRAFSSLAGSKKGVVNISVPMCQQSKQLTQELIPFQKEHNYHVYSDNDSLLRVLELLKKNKKILLLIGAGIRKSNATASLIAFAEKFSIPVATTMSAKGDFPESHALSLGVFGWSGTVIANELIMHGEIDCMVVVGSKLGQIATMGWSQKINQNRTLIQIDNNPKSLNRTYCADEAIVSDANAAFRFLNGQANEHDLLQNKQFRSHWIDGLKSSFPWFDPAEIPTSDLLPIHPASAIRSLSGLVSDSTQVFVDNGAHTFFAAHYWKTNKENHFFNTIKYSGAMGWAIPASIGAKLANPEKLTIAIVGDGCMLMHGIEIQTAARYNLSKMIFIVMNNQAHGNPKLRASNLSEDAQAITDIVDHDWAKFSSSLGVKGYTVRQTSELEKTFTHCLSSNEIALIDIKCGLYETPTKVFDQSFMTDFNKHLAHA